MRNYNYIPVLKDGVIYFVHIRDIEKEDIRTAFKEKDIMVGPGYFFQQFKEKYD